MNGDMVAAARGAVRPWDSVDAGESVYRVKLTPLEQRRIDICLNCGYPECCNCFDAWRNAFGNIRRKKRK